MKQKRKDKNQLEKESQDELKEIKNYMTEGKAMLDKAVGTAEIEEALGLFNKAISKASVNTQVPQVNQLYHLRGQCHFRLGQHEQAEKDFQEAILMSDDKNKGPFYQSLGKCKMQLALKDPIVVPIPLRSMNKP
jgi:tetratricopeptide (TPR) repeat protein